MADQTERLLLQVDAATELLRKHLAEGDQALGRFERRAEQTSARVDRSISQMGGKFGEFARLGESAADRVQRSFEESFSQVQRIAAKAIRGPTISGDANLGSADIRAGAEAAQQQARAFALIGEAAERTAVRVGDTSEATRLFIQATAASRIEAERQAAALFAEAGALERVEIELRQSAEATDLFVTSHQRVAQAAQLERDLAAATAAAALEQRELAASASALRSAIDPMYAAQQRFDAELTRADQLLAAGVISQREYAQAVQHSRDTLYAHAAAVAGAASSSVALTNNSRQLRGAMQGLSFQAQDTFTQLSMGTNVFSVLAIQGGQAAGQFANVEGRAGSFARFLIGPWGLAGTAALLVIGALTKDLDLFGDELEDEVSKLRASADASETTRIAKERFGNSLEGVTVALREQDAALRKTAEAERTAAERANITAKALRDKALAIRQNTAAQLADALAQEQALLSAARDQQRYGRGEAASVAAQLAQGRVAGLQAQIRDAVAKVAEAERQLNVTRVDLAAEQAAISIDPVRSITKQYDDRIKALKDQQREEARLGPVSGAESKRRLAQLEREKRAAVDAAQARQQAQRSSERGAARGDLTPGAVGDLLTNRFGGTITSTTGGKHSKGSYHYRGQAVDFVPAGGIGAISKGDLRALLEQAGVPIKELLGPGDKGHADHFHVAFGKTRRSQETIDSRAETLANRAEAARLKLIDAEISFGQQERAAQRRLTNAKSRSADGEEERERLARESINDEADAEKQRIAALLDARKLTAAQAQRLTSLNEATRTQQLANVDADRAQRLLSQRFDAEQDDLEQRLAILRISEDVAPTEAARRQVARDILAAEQELRRAALKRVRDTSNDPIAVARARRQLDTLPQAEAAESEALEQRLAGPVDQYRQRLRYATDDMNDALQDVAANGLASLEDGFLGIITGTESVGSAFKKMAQSIIADLARIAIQKAILSAIGTGFLGFADGGSIADAPGFADGGSPGGLIRGPGTSRSDSILALLKGPNGKPVRLSTREFIMNAGAVDFYGPDLMQAINARRLPRFADGGLLSAPRLQAVGALRSPRLPDLRGSRRDRLAVDVKTKVEASPLLLATVQETAVRTVSAAADPIMDGAKARTIKELNRQDLPGGYG